MLRAASRAFGTALRFSDSADYDPPVGLPWYRPHPDIAQTLGVQLGLIHLRRIGVAWRPGDHSLSIRRLEFKSKGHGIAAWPVVR